MKNILLFLLLLFSTIIVAQENKPLLHANFPAGFNDKAFSINYRERKIYIYQNPTALN